MNSNLLAALETPGSWWPVAFSIIAIVLGVFVFVLVWASRYTKVGPNQVLIVSGRKHRVPRPDGTFVELGTRFVTAGGGTFVLPVIEKADILSLEVFTVDVQEPDVLSGKGVPVQVQGVAHVKVKGDDRSIFAAAQHFLSKGTDAMRDVATQVIERHLRATLRSMKVEEVYGDHDVFVSKVQEAAAGDLATMGLSIVGFTIRDSRLASHEPPLTK